LLQSHSSANGMVALLSIYEKEDEAYQDLVTVATSFFQYLLQPFRDMRELACLYKMEILASMVKQMEEDKKRFGPAAWASAAPRLEKLRFLLAKETLQHMRAAEMCLSRKKDAIKERLENLSGSVQNRTQGSAFDNSQKHDSVDQLELQFYETQLELYDAKFEILKNEEQLLVAQIDTLRRQIKGTWDVCTLRVIMLLYECVFVPELKEEVVYYDVCEDPEELHSLVHTAFQQAESPLIRQLRRRLQTLETKRGNICARRAYLRNKKTQIDFCACVFRISARRPRSRSSWQASRAPYSSANITRSTWYVTTATRQPTHTLTKAAAAAEVTGFRFFVSSVVNVCLCCLQKREKRKEEEQRRKQWVDQEREKTLSRLRSFREVRLSVSALFLL
ncbi:hypothetical protein XENOCAPTIV_005209, partial [Xenoophorus captivus]